ncbi:MAG: leucine-rich repeat domain-containing protein [Cyclobacteriaceae bacterium]
MFKGIGFMELNKILMNKPQNVMSSTNKNNMRIYSIAIILFLFATCSPKKESGYSLLSDGELENQKIFTSVQEASSTQGIEVVKMDLSGSTNGKIPDEIFDLEHVQYLDLSNNGLKTIPADIAKLKNLQYLILSGNELSEIDPAIFELENLRDVEITSMSAGKSEQNMTVLETALLMKDLGEMAEYNELKKAPNLLMSSNEYYESACDRDVPPFKYSKHAYGYISNTSTGVSNIVAASSITSDAALRNKRLNINMAFLRAYDYPGGGEHNVFFGFHGSTIGSTSVQTDTEYDYNRDFKVNEDDEAALRSVPVFNGLFIGRDGVLFQCDVINVNNKRDERMTQIFQGIRSGMDIINITQTNPAVGMVGDVAEKALNIIQSGKRNVTVHKVELGLHFNNNGVDLQLREGSYIILTVPPCLNNAPFTFDWSKYKFDKTNGNFTDAAGTPISLKFNYVVFTITKAVQQQTPPIAPI